MKDNNFGKKFNELEPNLQIDILKTILGEKDVNELKENFNDLDREEASFVFKEALGAMKEALLKVQNERSKKLCEIENKHNFTKVVKENHMGFNNGVSYRYDVEVKQCERCGFIEVNPIGNQKRKEK